MLLHFLPGWLAVMLDRFTPPQPCVALGWDLPAGVPVIWDLNMHQFPHICFLTYLRWGLKISLPALPLPSCMGFPLAALQNFHLGGKDAIQRDLSSTDHWTVLCKSEMGETGVICQK